VDADFLQRHMHLIYQMLHLPLSVSCGSARLSLKLDVYLLAGRLLLSDWLVDSVTRKLLRFPHIAYPVTSSHHCLHQVDIVR